MDKQADLKRTDLRVQAVCSVVIYVSATTYSTDTPMSLFVRLAHA